jgi:predicted transcriptional regulator
MDRLWRDAEAANVVKMHGTVGTPRGLKRSTIHSTLERLVRKGLVSRRRHGREYHYRATLTRSAWIAEAIDSVVGNVGANEQDEVLAGFVDFADRTSETTLESLAELIRTRLRARDGHGSG